MHSVAFRLRWYIKASIHHIYKCKNLFGGGSKDDLCCWWLVGCMSL
jgi:hypothetical protein